ncbi:MAG: rRNA maturation RNase YbeY [Clostridiales bacterium]|uniref:rRNA maturation RNase YbeY n=1 Tax=Clostridium sp. N3C TaxID=1776758 RepID=UPI00092DED7D|nr:rRNA maturation RNase YbeY [Clostridium sp. N3C]NLZ48417.1 rRNA maturation RNase YbeY [Clostridiales bacterium]SCN21793.1 Endoribonuclease YbeY [Clostridium sp. N3C]
MIYVENMQNKINWSEEEEINLKEVIDFALREEGLNHPYQVSVLLVNNDEIKDINGKHRKIDKVTDVLSFPLLDYPEGKVFKEIYGSNNFHESMLDDGELVLGDIVLSLERAMEQSVEYGHSFKREISYLVIHSVLHLLGYDHIKEEDKMRMREREEYILSRFNIYRD